MKTFLKPLSAAAGLVASVAFVTAFSVAGNPVATEGYSLLGHNLGLSQRDFRIVNNFVDSQSSNNTTPHHDYPGATGAVMAIWKAHSEWGSDPHGTGTGDSVNGNVIGSGNADFDFTYQGTTNIQTNYVNTHRVLQSSSGSTYAYMQGGGTGWHIRYYDDSWTWNDGPGNVFSGADIQGIGVHEVGHALGLGHSSAGGSPTMLPSTFIGVNQRTIESDDIAGLQAIYGAESAAKPDITSIGGSTALGETLIINGSDFSPTNNEVWFTKLASDGNPAKVTGVASTNGGTRIEVTIPAFAIKGDVLVKKDASGHSALSNAWPLDVTSGTLDPPAITNVTPDTGPNAGYTEVTIFGLGLMGVHTVQFDGVDAVTFTVVGPTQITATTPAGTLNQVADVTVIDDDGTFTLADAFTYGFNTPIDVDGVSPASGPAGGGQEVTITGPNVIPMLVIRFGGPTGPAATGIDIVSQTELTCVTPPGVAGSTVDIFFQGYGQDTLVGAYTYLDQGAFVNIGPGVGGSFGVPELSGTGDLTVNGSGFTLNVNGVKPSAAGLWFIGLVQAAVPLEGGTLYPFPWLLEVPILVDPAGSLAVPGVINDVSLSGVDVITQMWFFDDTGPTVATATNGLRLEIP